MPTDVILELRNPEVELAAEEAETQAQMYEAETRRLEQELKASLLNLEARLAQTAAEATLAAVNAQRDAQLAQHGLISDLERSASTARADTLLKVKNHQDEELKHMRASARLQIKARAKSLQRLQQRAALERARAEALQTKAGIAGVLQELVVEPGQRVAFGQALAVMADPLDLKAEVQVNQGRAQSLAVGQSAIVNLAGREVQGQVVRIDPTIRQGSLTLDIALNEPWPDGARTQASISARITVAKLEDVLYLDRPTQARPDSSGFLYALTSDGQRAIRHPVVFGQASVSHIQILKGLPAGARVILSDTSRLGPTETIEIRR